MEYVAKENDDNDICSAMKLETSACNATLELFGKSDQNQFKGPTQCRPNLDLMFLMFLIFCRIRNIQDWFNLELLILHLNFWILYCNNDIGTNFTYLT